MTAAKEINEFHHTIKYGHAKWHRTSPEKMTYEQLAELHEYTLSLFEEWFQLDPLDLITHLEQGEQP